MRVLVSVAWLCASSCTSASTNDAAREAAIRAEITVSLESYQVAARTADPDKIAAFYAPTGVLLEPGIPPIEGRDAIRAFLASFPGVRVEVADATPERIEVFENNAYVWGSFFERLSFPGQPVSEQSGHFVIEWAREPDRPWFIERYYRIPVATTEMPAAR